MKKIFFSAIVLALGYSISAQEPVILSTTTSHPAYSVPNNISTTFQTTYPNVTVVTWEPVSTWWRATYNDNNRIRKVYYTTSGEGFIVALPVINTNIPEDVVDKAINMNSSNIYGITKLRGANNMDVYQVHLIENGNSRYVYMDGSGNTLQQTDVFKSGNSNTSSTTTMN
jgi:hypothetical protein